MTKSFSSSVRKPTASPFDYHTVCKPSSASQLLVAISDRYEFTVQPPRARTLRYLDTHDWTLYGEGLMLEWLRTGQHEQLRLRNRLGGESLLTVPGPRHAPCKVADLEAAPLRRFLWQLGHSRALLATGKDERLVNIIELRDKRAKVVLRLDVEFPVDTKSRNLPTNTQITLLPLRGYQTPLAHAREALERYGALPCKVNRLDTLLASESRAPWTYPDLSAIALSSQMEAYEGLRAALKCLLATMRDCEAGVRHQWDIEFLHDFRVATRRIRSTIRDLPGVLAPAIATTLHQDLGHIARMGGKVRDLDVLLEDSGRLICSLPREELERVHTHFQALRSGASQELLSMLDGDGYRRTLDTLDRICADTGNELAGARGSEDIRSLLEFSMRRLRQRILKDGRKVDSDTPADRIHALRKRCKRLRYLVDVFTTLYQKRTRKSVVAAMKTIQDDLGEYQDCDVQLVHLMELRKCFEAKTCGEDEVSQSTTNRLRKRVMKRQHEALVRFTQHFSAFHAQERKRDLSTLFRRPRKMAGRR